MIIVVVDIVITVLHSERVLGLSGVSVVTIIQKGSRFVLPFIILSPEQKGIVIISLWRQLEKRINGIVFTFGPIEEGRVLGLAGRGSEFTKQASLVLFL